MSGSRNDSTSEDYSGLVSAVIGSLSNANIATACWARPPALEKPADLQMLTGTGHHWVTPASTASHIAVAQGSKTADRVAEQRLRHRGARSFATLNCNTEERTRVPT